MKASLITVKEASFLLHVHPETLRRWTRGGRVPFLKVEDEIRFDRSEIEDFIERRKARILADCPPLTPLGLDRYDKLYLKGGQAALSSRNSRRWRYAIGRIYLRRTKKGLDRWWIDYRGPEGQRRREVVKDAQNRGEALAALQQKVSEVFDGKFHPKRIAQQTKFNELADCFMNDYAKKTKKSWKTDEYRLVTLREHFGEMDLASIATAGILEYRQARLKAGRSELTANRETALLKTLFNFAREEGLMKENPARKVRMFSERDTARDRVLSPDEEERLFAELALHLRPVVLTALHTGMRLGEILNLKWSDVNLERRIVKIEKTKSKRTRFIPANSILQAELARLKAERRGPLVFPFKNVRTGFENARSRAGLENFTFHDLRRTFGTRLLEHGVNIVTISRLYGHSNVLVTQNYLHPRDVLSVEAVELLAGEKREKPESLAQIWHTEKGAAFPVPERPMKSVS
jgi:excisionase family DNA binding protein